MWVGGWVVVACVGARGVGGIRVIKGRAPWAIGEAATTPC